MAALPKTLSPTANRQMNRILYTVTAEIVDPSIRESWQSWMLTEHMSEVVKAGARCAYLVSEDSSNLFHAMYEFESRAKLAEYLELQAPKLRAKGASVFPPETVRYSRTTGELFAVK